VQKYLNTLTGLSPSTVRRAAYSLSGLFSHLQREGTISINPAAGLVLPKRRRRLPKFPAAQQAQRLIGAAHTKRDRALISLLLMGGLRRSELLGVDVAGLSEDLSELRIIGKGDAERLIPLPVDAQVALVRHIEDTGIRQGLIFLNREGNRLDNTALQRIWKRLLLRAGLEDEGYTIHSCRHAYGSELARCGTDLCTIQELMGHADISTTAIYLHSDLRSKREAVTNLPFGQDNTGGDAR